MDQGDTDQDIGGFREVVMWFVGFYDAPDGAFGVQFGHGDDVFWWLVRIERTKVLSSNGVATVTSLRTFERKDIKCSFYQLALLLNY